MYQNVQWKDESGTRWELMAGIVEGQPCLLTLSYFKEERLVKMAGPLFPEFEVVTGIRKPTAPENRQSLIRNEQEFYEARWNTYADHPMGRKNEVSRHQARFASTTMEIRTVGTETVLDFDGVTAGNFHGDFYIHVYEGSSLLKLELAASTQDPSCAYFYCGGLKGFSIDRLYYRSLQREMISELPRRLSAKETSIRVDARNRILCLQQNEGSAAVFPPPHKFFWARQNENCVGYNYYRRETDGTLTIGVRHNEDHEYKGDRWACYNAPPGTIQHMSYFLCVSSRTAADCRETAMRYTNQDVFRPLPGYQRMLAHFHMAYHLFWEQDPQAERPWEKLFKEIGCDIAMLCDYWGDGEFRDNREARLEDLQRYHRACATHSDDTFLILPAEEIAKFPGDDQPEIFPGHWMFLPSKPVLYSRHREADQEFAEKLPDGRTYYHWETPEEVLEMCRRENCMVFMPHPETKANDGYPYCVKEEKWLYDPLYWGIGFRYLPSDNASETMIDGRVSKVWDDLNNWSDRPRYCMGELDTYQKKSEWDMYGDMNVTYVKLDSLPKGSDWSSLLAALQKGECFVSTGEVLIEESTITDGQAKMTISWTFPMEFAQLVYSDGSQVTTVNRPVKDQIPFRRTQISFTFPKGMKWARLSAWDTAGNGAFGQPVFL